MLRILINCPGGWSHGLDSPERGEGRWAQNLARCLGQSGLYRVDTCSGGDPTWGRGVVEPSVTLLSEGQARDRGPYDLYFDAAWWHGKEPVARARHYFHVHFGFESRLGVKFPPNHYLVYVLENSRLNYFGSDRENADRTFFLPAPFGESMAVPDPARRQILHTMRGSDAPDRRNRFEMLYAAVTRLRERFQVPFVWIQSAGLESPRHPEDRVIIPDAAWGTPYCDIRQALMSTGLNPCLDGWSNLLDSTVMGVPSLAWEGGIDPAPIRVATQYGLNLGPNSTTEEVYLVMARLFSDPGCYAAYTRSLQNAYQVHTTGEVLRRFAQLVASVEGYAP